MVPVSACVIAENGRTLRWSNNSLAALLGSIAVLGISAADTLAQGDGEQQCSLAVVSGKIGNGTRVCDNNLVQQMAKQGHAFEENQMGLASVLAIGPDYSEKEAVKWFERAALRGYAPAQVNLAVMYLNGWGVPVNYGAAQYWLRAAADRHFARAYYNLGILYLEGNGVKRDNAEAFRWFEKGAEAGDSSAQSNLGYMYDQGLGCERNLANAATWYRKAAESGNVLGENNLADLYLRGEGLPQDDHAAFTWFQKAAAQGHTGAQIKLGYMYAQGRSTAKDLSSAYAWLYAATAAGDPRGKELLHSVEKTLSKEQAEAALQRSQAFRHGEQKLAAKSFLQ